MLDVDPYKAFGLLASIATVVGIFLAFCEFRRQRILRDTDDAFNLVSRAQDHWEKIHLYPDRELFYLGGLLSFYEILCRAYLKKHIGKSARDILKIHLVDVFNLIALHDSLSQNTRAMKTRKDTFEEIVAFLKQENASDSTIDLFESFHEPTE